MPATSLARSTTRVVSSSRSIAVKQRHHGTRFLSTKPQIHHEHRAWQRPSAALLAAAATVAFIYSTSFPDVQAEAAEQPPELVFEKIKKSKKGASKEDNRNLISSQHTQVKRSWENPGVYVWGTNSGRVAAPDSAEAYIRTPRRLPWFDDVLLRDLKLDRQFGAAILENGDLVQWGKGYSPESTSPSVTLKGKDLKQIQISRDRIIALSKSGQVYSIPASKTDQEEQPKVSESSWIPFWGGTSHISYRKISPQLGYSEKITSISSGLEHVLLLTSSGRVFSAASSMEGFPSRGQLGVPGVTWLTRPSGPFDMPHEITTLKGFEITGIATGDTHSLALDREGRVFAFGDNSSGQLGMYSGSESPFIDVPSLVPTTKMYPRDANQTARVTSIAAGGLNSFFTVDATRIAGQDEDPRALGNLLGRVTADTFACGQGLRGTLGNGRWTHIQDSPSRIPTLSGLFEYDEINKKTIPIRIASISVGSSHASATLDNVTYLDASEHSGKNDTNWGADCLWWGGNEHYQLGTGKRNNVANPVYIRPLDMDAEVQAGRKEEHRFHVTPRSKVVVKGRKVNLEQRVECGGGLSAVYSRV
ncbi:Protein FMP25, mitochondrial [Cyphellophora attinorum]|uniref:Protein FMP25, mitochondrial n=1 Tax=Cyphellophora attinorum TaxID=1664694 RepID=A0A0N0NNC5_9EURO|nr:Protein FMP25, mitochondrial [Phialophora attinorum]KPI41368.1 Protein FMP25, mitochondrial [Phialophora attinorum]